MVEAYFGFKCDGKREWDRLIDQRVGKTRDADLKVVVRPDRHGAFAEEGGRPDRTASAEIGWWPECCFVCAQAFRRADAYLLGTDNVCL